MSFIKVLGLIYLVIIIACFFEAFFYSKLDPESEKELKEREVKLNKEENGNKRNS